MGDDLSCPRQKPAVAGWPGRFWGIIFDPVRTFAVIVCRPDFWAPLLALAGVAAAAAEILLRRFGMAEIVRRSIELSGRAGRITPEQMQRAVSQGARVGSVAAHLRAPVSVTLFLLVVAAIGSAILKAIYGLPIDFKTAFAVVAYADLPAALAGLLAIAVVAFGDPARLNPGNIHPTNIGFYLSPLSVSRPLYALAASIDVSTVWFMGLFSIGLAAAVKGKVRPRSIFFCLLGLWAVWVAVKVGFAAL